MKNSLGAAAIERIAQSFALADKDFLKDHFVLLANDDIEQLELKARVFHIIEALAKCLPQDFEKSAEVLHNVKEVWVKGTEKDSFQAFAAWPVIDYISVYGIEYPDLALPLLRHLTSLFSAEFAIRAFIVRYPELCQDYFSQWVNDPDEHVRRLVSEGSRPRLPWGVQLALYIKEPATNLKHLQLLKQDQSLYVRRSVANHLNDIAKDHPELVIDVCESWLAQADDKVKWVVSHATRSLVKQGHRRVYSLLGYTKKPQLAPVEIEIANECINMGQSVAFNFSVASIALTQQHLVVDYALGFMKANGEIKEKVFKLKNIKLKANQNLSLSKSHSFKAISTRRYYPGAHSVSILVNGETVARSFFKLQNDE